MSFGIAISDFIALGETARRLYTNVYKVARAAPAELGNLEKELGLLSQAIGLLVDELQDEDSVLRQAGPDRIRMVNEMKDYARETLTQLGDFSRKHNLAEVATNSGRNKLQRGWDKLAYSKDARTIDCLRSKLVYHYSVMQLLLTSVGNSSLQRFETDQKAIATDVKDIITILAGKSLTDANDHLTTTPPTISGLDDAGITPLISTRFKEEAEKRGSWLAIGIDAWVQAGKWWMMRGQLSLKGGEQHCPKPYQAYLNLLKASWILTDVLSTWYMRTFAVDNNKNQEVLRLSRCIKAELLQVSGARLRAILESPNMMSQDFAIWSEIPSTLLDPRTSVDLGDDQYWDTDEGIVVFQGFARYTDKRNDPRECLVLLILKGQPFRSNLICQTANGADLWKWENLDSTSLNLFVSRADGDEDCSIWWGPHVKRGVTFFRQGDFIQFEFDDLSAMSGFLRCLVILDYCIQEFALTYFDLIIVIRLFKAVDIIFRLVGFSVISRRLPSTLLQFERHAEPGCRRPTWTPNLPTSSEDTLQLLSGSLKKHRHTERCAHPLIAVINCLTASGIESRAISFNGTGFIEPGSSLSVDMTEYYHNATDVVTYIFVRLLHASNPDDFAGQLFDFGVMNVDLSNLVPDGNDFHGLTVERHNKHIKDLKQRLWSSLVLGLSSKDREFVASLLVLFSPTKRIVPEIERLIVMAMFEHAASMAVCQRIEAESPTGYARRLAATLKDSLPEWALTQTLLSAITEAFRDTEAMFQSVPGRSMLKHAD